MMERRQKVWALRLQGKPEAEIGAEVSASTATVCRDLKYLIQEATKHLDDEVKRERLLQLYQHRLIFREAWDAWERSKGEITTVTQRKIPPSRANQDERVEISATKTTSAGNPAFLREMRETLKAILNLFGIEAFRDDWERELRDAGLDPAEIFETMVQSAYAAIGEKQQDETVSQESTADY
jgi:hypothetical protein